MTTYKCPVECGEGPFGTKNGAVMHAFNKQDETHESVNNVTNGYDLLMEMENQEAAEESGSNKEGRDSDTSENEIDDESNADVTTTEFPEAPDGPADEPVVADSSASEEDLEDTPEDTPGDDLEATLDDVPTPEGTDGRATEGLALAAAGLVLGLIYFKTRGGSHQTTDDGPGFEVV